MNCTRKEPQYPLSGTVPLACLPYEEADRVSIPTPTKEVEDSETIPEEGTASATEIVDV